MSLSDRVKAAQEQAMAGADQAVTGLAEITAALDFRSWREQLDEIREQLRSDVFKITIFGRMKSGKSTFLNLLLADVTHPVDLGGAAGPLPTDDLPCSPLVTTLVYSPVPYVKAFAKDGTCDTWSLHRYLREAQLDSPEENARRFGELLRFEIGYPARLLQNVVLVDTPGTDENEGRDVLAEMASESSDAILVAFRSSPLMGATEVNAAWQAVRGKLGVFTVVNMWSGSVPDHRFRGRVWDTYVRPGLTGGETQPWAGQDLEGAHRVYFVDVGQSLDAKLRGDEATLTATGMAAFEDRLVHFLANERAAAHIVSHANRAEQVASELAAAIDARRRRERQGNDEFAAWNRQMQVALYEAESRGTVIGELVESHRKQIVEVLRLTHRDAEHNIQKDLEQHLMEVKIPVLETLTGAMWTNTVQAEMQAAAEAFVQDRRQVWMKGAGSQLTGGLGRLGRELARALDRAIEPVTAANLQLSGPHWDRDYQVVSTGEKIAAAALAVVTLNAAAAVGAGGGFRPVLSSIGGMAVGGVILAAGAAVLGAPITVPALVVTAVIGALGGALGGSWWNVRKRFLSKLVPKLNEALEASQSEREQALVAQVDGNLDDYRAEVERGFQAALDQQRDELAKQIQIRSQENAVREQHLRELERAAAAVVTHRAALRDAVRIGRQQISTAS